MISNRVAAIDIGTNSIRGIVVEADKTGKLRVLDDEKISVRLGDGLVKENRINPSAWRRAIDGISRIKKIADGYGVRALEAVATSAVRLADNGEAFVRAVADETGLEIAVISGQEEAELAALSVSNNFDMEGVRYGIADIGGGSVEVVTALSGHIEEIHSLDLGTVFLTEKFIKHDPVSDREIKKMRKHIYGMLAEAFNGEVISLQSLIGSGGTITSTAAMVMAMRKEAYGTVHGYEVLHFEIVHLLAMLSRKDLKGRKAVPGINPERADIIIAGITILECLMDFFNANLLKVNERGIREGLILRMMKKHKMIKSDSRAKDWRQSAIEFAHSCHFDESHSFQVARLALELYKKIAPVYRFSEKEAQILEAAAILHDIGYLISYAGHHKHSYHLIRHAGLFGFTPREREIIAQVARYHRKSAPGKDHESYKKLSSDDRMLVRRLGGILRLADGLDRRRNSIVNNLECSLDKKTFTIRIESNDDVSVELYGGENKKKLFEDAFGLEVIFNNTLKT